jgi:hypothetical protein
MDVLDTVFVGYPVAGYPANLKAGYRIFGKAGDGKSSEARLRINGEFGYRIYGDTGYRISC